MLFDVRGRRKRVIQVVYVGLAVLFGASLVLFGTGSGVNGGLFDAITGGGGGNNSVFSDQYKAAQKRARLTPKNPGAQTELVRASFNLAASTEGSDSQTGQLTDKGQQAITSAAAAWERYLKLKPKQPDPGTAQFAALAYGALQDYPHAVKTQRVVAEQRPSANSWFQLADFAYRAGDVTTGDRAAAEALRRTPKDQRNTVRDLIKNAKKQGAQIAEQIKAQRKQARQNGTSGKDAGAAFGPLPGAGTTGSSGVTP
jgi:tetratricopeptide (TPR) repeat protein